MKILVVLQTMYDGSGVDKKAPLIFKINPFNKSGKKMLEICGGKYNEKGHYVHEEHDVWFTNVSSVLAGGGANSIRPVDLEFVTKAILSNKWDLIIWGGNHSKKVFQDHYHGKNYDYKTILMPHPASRNFTNALKQTITNYVKDHSNGPRVIEFVQEKEKKISVIFHQAK